MTPSEAGALLTVAAAYDNRKPDADAAQAWALALDGYNFHDCRDVIVEHYKKSREWIMPFDVLTAVKRLRTKRLHEAPVLTPPPDLTPLETNAWLRNARRRLANGEAINENEGRGELIERRLPELRALIQRGPAKPEPEPLLTAADHSREPDRNPAAVAAREQLAQPEETTA